MTGPKYSAGDAVTFTNDYGVVFHRKVVVGLDGSGWSLPEPRYFIEPTDSPWFSVKESNLQPEVA